MKIGTSAIDRTIAVNEDAIVPNYGSLFYICYAKLVVAPSTVTALQKAIREAIGLGSRLH